MKKICFFLLTALLLQPAFAQTDTFDILQYTPPKDFKKENKPGGIVFSQANDSTGLFCAIIIFASTSGSGDAIKDFKSQWTELAVKKYNVDPNPETEKAKNADGWQMITGASLFKIKEKDAYIILTLFSGFGKRVSVISTLNDNSYLAKLDDFLETVRFNKSKSIPKKPVPKKINATPGTKAISGAANS
jgi:hypothetical protein